MIAGTPRTCALSPCRLNELRRHRVSFNCRARAEARPQARQQHAPVTVLEWMADAGRQCCLATAAAGLVLLSSGMAEASEKVASFPASGFVFKDSVNVLAVEGVTIYISDFQRSFTDKLAANDFFTEPSQASVTCSVTGRLVIPDMGRINGKEGAEVFSERKNLFNVLKNKTLRVRRIYDSERKTLLYVAYATHSISSDTSPGRYRTSICAIPLSGSLGEAGELGIVGAEPISR